MSVKYIVYLANYSDGILYLMAVLLLLALAVILDRFWFLRSTILRGESVIRATAQETALRQGELVALRNRAGKLPEAALLDTALRHAGMVNAEALNSRLDEAVMLIAPGLDRRLWLLDTIITLAPLMGLFGTIIGMFHAFNVLAAPGHAPAEVTGGVADALVATAFGLFIAMLGLAAFNALSNQVRLVVHQLDSLKVLIVNRMDGAPVVQAGKTGAGASTAAKFATA
ncbi:MotA/TolQ/ExbB proton channel family protein [Acidocella sp. MX-AZ03]|nr:MotA/TolQ/ExbB proton channel family protein [Acidocella sp. MX-AZ03]WBO59030.1 MotA/TolQ/ExbB proton channel family protein [Acidocella sp. MX-AZ03]